MPIREEMKHRYPKDWPLRSRFVRFYRARNRCEWCGAENRKPHPVTGAEVILTAAHVFDKRPEAASLLNLAALCQRCHNQHDAAERQKARREREAFHQLEMALWMAKPLTERLPRKRPDLPPHKQPQNLPR